MKISRLAGLVVGLVLAASLAVGSVASAASDPQFLGTFPTKFTALSLAGILATANNNVKCTHDTLTGTILGPAKVSNVVVTFTGCTGKEGTKEECPAKSAGGTTGSIVTKTLDGELGLVATGEAKSGAGLLLLPETGKVFVEIACAAFEPTETAIEGSVAGEVTPLDVSSTTGKVLLGGAGGVQSIKKITVLGTSIEPKLKAFGTLVASESTEESILFEHAIEVM